MEVDNCSACTVSGASAAYLSTTNNSNYPTCVNPCGPREFPNKVTRTCDPCNILCDTCINNENYCTSCVGGEYWTG